MAESYVPQEITVTCSFMTISDPLNLGIPQGSRNITIIHTNKKQPLLNINDKKISDTFKCKVGQSFWQGFATLCIGLAVGIVLGAAIVMTGGAAAVVVLAVAGGLLATGVGASIYGGLIAPKHECDITLDSEWFQYHKSVNIDKHKALLNKSFLECKQGGLIQIIMDPILAQEAANDISWSNGKGVLTHMGSQFIMGGISGVLAFGNPIGVILTTGLSLDNYRRGQDGNPNNDSPLLGFDGVSDEIKDTAIGLPFSFVDGINEITSKNQATQALMGVGNGTYLGMKDVFKSFGKSLGVGVIGALVNLGIDKLSDNIEEGFYEEALENSDNFNTQDKDNGINVVAQDS